MLSTSESSRGALASFAVSDLSSLSLSLLAHPPPLPAPPPKPPNQRPQVNLRELRKLAVVNGLGTNALRARAWPLLLGARAGADDLDVLQRLSSASSPSACSSDSDPDGGKRGPPPPPLHRDSAVVDVDVERSLWAFTRGWSEGAKASARAALRRVINASVAEASRELQGRAEAQEDGNTERIGDEASAAEKLRQPRRKREASRSSSSSSLPEEEAESKGNGGRSGTGNDGRSGTGGGNGTGGGDGNGIGGGGVNSGASTVPGPPRRRLGPAPRHGQRGRGVPPAAEAGRLPAPRLHPADARRGARGVRPAPADRRQGRPAAREGLGQLALSLLSLSAPFPPPPPSAPPPPARLVFIELLAQAPPSRHCCCSPRAASRTTRPIVLCSMKTEKRGERNAFCFASFVLFLFPKF